MTLETSCVGKMVGWAMTGGQEGASNFQKLEHFSNSDRPSKVPWWGMQCHKGMGASWKGVSATERARHKVRWGDGWGQTSLVQIFLIQHSLTQERETVCFFFFFLSSALLYSCEDYPFLYHSDLGLTGLTWWFSSRNTGTYLPFLSSLETWSPFIMLIFF